MDIYSVATISGDLNPSIFKLISKNKLFWRWECKMNTMYFFILEDKGTVFFKPARTLRVQFIKDEILAEFEEGDLDEYLLCG